jgi:hypothetical protein
LSVAHKRVASYTHPSVFWISLLPFRSDIQRAMGVIIPFRKIRQKTARYLFATHIPKYLLRVHYSIVQFSSYLKSEGTSGVLRKKRDRSAVHIFDTNPIRKYKKTLQKHGTYRLQKGPRDCRKRVRPSCEKLTSKRRQFPSYIQPRIFCNNEAKERKKGVFLK